MIPTITLTPTEQAALVFFKSIAMRFIKGAVAGMLAALGAISIQVPHTWADLSSVLVALSYAAIIGFFTGGFLALEKWYTWIDTTPQTP